MEGIKMVSQKQTVYYLIDRKNKKYHFFDNFTERNELREELGIELIDTGQERLKHYYGTVWILYKWEDDIITHYIEGRKKEIDLIKKYNKCEDYKLEKIVVMSYKDFIKKNFPTPEEDDSSEFRGPPTVLF
jgi:hypothetical protein